MVRIFLKNFYSLVIIHLCPSYRDPFYILIVRKSKRTKVMLLHHSRPSLASLRFFRVFPLPYLLQQIGAFLRITQRFTFVAR